MAITSPAPDITLRVVVVNYNSNLWLQRCVAALERSSTPLTLSIVDNASTDSSLRVCQALAAEGPAEVLCNDRNRGFAAACNQVALAAPEPFVCILNPDCELEPRALEFMCAALKENPDAALAGALVNNPDGSLQRASLRRLPAPGRALITALGLERLGLAGVNVREPPPAKVCETEAVSGAVMLLRTKCLRAVGGLDESYFLHCEDLDLFVRLAQAGWRLLLVPQARAVHGLSISQKGRPWFAHRCKHQSLTRYFARHVAVTSLGALGWRLAIGVHYIVTAPLVLWPRRKP